MCIRDRIGTPHTIARIRNPEYEKQLHFMREELGLSMVVNPEKATAREIARVLRFPSAIKREQFCRQRFELVEYRINEGNPLEGLQLSDLYRNIRVKILICAVARGQQTIIPTGATVLQKGDKIYLDVYKRQAPRRCRGRRRPAGYCAKFVRRWGGWRWRPRRRRSSRSSAGRAPRPGLSAVS